MPYSLLQRDIERDLLPMAEAFGLSVAAWSPLGGGVLSGKFTSGNAPVTGTRVATSAISERDFAIARAVDAAAAKMNTTSAAVALAWTMQRSLSLHPIIGARSLEQLNDNLGAVDLELPSDVVSALERAAPFEVGFPNDFIDNNRAWVFGSADALVEPIRRLRP